MKSTLTLTCSDQFQLQTTCFTPPSNDFIKGNIIIASAFGVSQSFYWPIAEFFCAQGYEVTCFDYRGTGDNEDLGKVQFKLEDWGVQDLEAVIARCLVSDLPTHIIGHSIGGQLLGLAPSSTLLSSASFVAASAPYWKRWPRLADGLKIKVNVGFILPLVSRFYSPFPADKFGLGNQNLPSTAVQQWARWMTKPDYLLAPEFGLDCSAYKQINYPILSFAFTDDLLAPIENISHLLKQFIEADCTTKHIDPSHVGAKHIGHTGLFKNKFEASLWRDIYEFIRENNNRKTA